MNVIVKWIYKVIGKDVSKKLGLEDKEMETTPWYKSKAKLAAIVGALLVALGQVSTALGHPIVIPQWVLEILGAIGIYGIRDAIQK
jgi:hypothetical protein